MNEIIIASVGLAVSVVAGICVPICCNRDEVVNQVIIIERQIEPHEDHHDHHLKFSEIIMEIDEVSK